VERADIRGMIDRSDLVLMGLSAGPKHGYALIQDISAFAGVRLGPGTLYGCLSRLERDGLIEALPPDELRHPYRITAEGLAALEARLSQSARIAAFGLERIAGASS